EEHGFSKAWDEWIRYRIAEGVWAEERKKWHVSYGNRYFKPYFGSKKLDTISAEVAGTSGLTKVGPGTLNLSSAASTYSGGTRVSAGVLGAQASSALGGGSVSVTGGAALQVDGDGLNLANALTLNGTGISSGGALRNLANTNTCSGAITLGSASRINSDAGTLTLNSGTAISGATLEDGTGTVSLSGANTYTGTTTVSSGELDLANWGGTTLGTVTVGNTAGVTATLGITGGTFPMGGVAFFVGTGGAVGIVNQSGGTVSFTTQNLDLLIGNGGVASGTYNLSGGTLSASFSSTARGVMLGVNSGASATFSLSGTGVLSLPGAELAVGRDDAGQTGCTAVYSQSGGSATVGYLSIGGQSGSTTTTAYLSIGGQSGSTTTTATFSITAGTFVAPHLQHLAPPARSSATLTLGGSAQVILPAFPVPAGTANLTFDFTSGYLSPYAASTTYLQGLTHAYLTTNGANFNVGSGNDITVAQVLHDATAGGTLTKSGAGTLTLSGANTYTGNTTVNGGTLEIVQPTLAANSTVTVASSAVLQLDFAVTNTVAALVLNSVSQPAGVYDSISGAPYLTGMGSLLVSSGIATNPTNIVASVAGNQLTLSWPADHTGWQLQSNSVSVADSNAWFLVPGSTTTNQVILTIDPAQSNVFFRMHYTP
ncbi:MAG: autotransporter-associated beta strand repeat-containing protein, partial [Verrucomicrobia bacterium]|nr:autotransporter-associated beta strand repeat-containing protein [Verrucomicrobiota bacterium]